MYSSCTLVSQCLLGIKLTFIITATTSSSTSDPSSFMELVWPVTICGSIKEIMAQRADIHVRIVLAEILHRHPEEENEKHLE